MIVGPSAAVTDAVSDPRADGIGTPLAHLLVLHQHRDGFVLYEVISFATMGPPRSLVGQRLCERLFGDGYIHLAELNPPA